MSQSILYYTAAAFLGGVILNVMPCVLPVLTMKVFHVIENAKADPSVNRRHGLAYAAGIMVMFWAFAAIIIALRASGERMGWGMQFQSPVFVAVMTALMVTFGLNALGVFDLTIGMGDVTAGEGYLGSFVNGVVASIMSTPCSAPFLGAAATFALGSGAVWWQTLLMFSFIGLGLACPFLIISYVPAVGKRLPRPGAWMETFKHLMGFTLLAAALWLYGTLQAQLTRDGSFWFLAFLLVLSVALWGMQHFGGIERSTARRWVVRAAAAGLVVAAGFWLDFEPPARSARATNLPPHSDDGGLGVAPVVVDGRINWTPFDPARIKAENARGRPVFVDFTADWCANCKVNEKTFIETDTIRADLERTKILPMQADFTSEDDTIQQWIDELGRAGVPIYVILNPDGTRDLLPETITTRLLSDALRKASSRFPPEKLRPLGGDSHATKDTPAGATATQQ